MNTTSGPFSERMQHSKVFKSRYFSNSDHKPWTCCPNIWLVKTLEWQAPVQLPSTPTLGVFLIVIVLHTFHPCKWLDIVVCSKDCLIADLSDHVFYGGCFSVDCWLTYRPPCLSRFGRVSSDCRSWFGRYIGRVVFPVGRQIDRQSVVIASVVCRQCIGEIVGRVLVRYRWCIGIEKMSQHSSFLLRYEAAGQNWFRFILFWPLELQSWSD